MAQPNMTVERQPMLFDDKMLAVCGPIPPWASASEEDLEAAVALLVRRIEQYREAWERHPDYRWYYYEHPVFRHEPDPWNPVVVACFKHAPGVKEHTESYIISTLQDVTAPRTLRWGERALGAFDSIRPIRPDLPVDPVRQVFLSFSYRSSGKAFRARQELKRLLPRKLRSYVSKARSAYSKPKAMYVQLGMTAEGAAAIKAARQSPHYDAKQTFVEIARWHNPHFDRMTKLELLTRFFFDEEQQWGIEQHISIEDFWQCATGKVHPYNVAFLVKDDATPTRRQLRLFDAGK